MTAATLRFKEDCWYWVLIRLNAEEIWVPALYQDGRWVYPHVPVANIDVVLGVSGPIEAPL